MIKLIPGVWHNCPSPHCYKNFKDGYRTAQHFKDAHPPYVPIKSDKPDGPFAVSLEYIRSK